MSDKLSDIQWPETNKTRLVLIQGKRYSMYKGRKHIVTIEPEEPLTVYWLEQFRQDPSRVLPDPPIRSA